MELALCRRVALRVSRYSSSACGWDTSDQLCRVRYDNSGRACNWCISGAIEWVTGNGQRIAGQGRHLAQREKRTR